jgi:HD superfamily phosphohydrolase
LNALDDRCGAGFEADYDQEGFKKPAEHELMSALLCLTSEELNVRSLFPEEKAGEDLAFIVRAIIGCVYFIPETDAAPRDKASFDRLAIRNALIRILHASLIDVDKLDYIVRDSTVTGYRNVEMDLPRLMGAFSLERNGAERHQIWPVYKKSALSIIEHVLIARNNEMKWIQSHNAVVYEIWLLQRAVCRVLRERLGLAGQRLTNFFCPEAFSGGGHTLNGKTWRYLSDEDILSLLKEHYDIPEVHEFFDRASRKKAVWKMHADYIATFQKDTEKVFAFFARFMTSVDDHESSAHSRDGIKALIEASGLSAAERQPYALFFKNIERDLDGATNFDLLFLEYSASVWTNSFDPQQIYLKYDIGCITYAEATRASAAVVGNAPNLKGFFVFYNGDRIGASDFKKAYQNALETGG